jgi:hypothetical protein
MEKAATWIRRNNARHFYTIGQQHEVSMRKELLTDRDDLFVIHDFLTPDECRHYIALSESVGYVDAPITTLAGFVMRKDIRDNARVIHDDVKLAADMWERLEPHMPDRVSSGSRSALTNGGGSTATIRVSSSTGTSTGAMSARRWSGARSRS